MIDSIRNTTADERTILEAFLDEQRAELVRKVRGVGEEDARARLVASATTLAGLVKHLCVLSLDEVPRHRWPWPFDAGPDAGFWPAACDTLEALIAEYEHACERSRERASLFALDHVVPNHHHERVSLRWIYAHMIEETARHAGHADILREQLDGARSG